MAMVATPFEDRSFRCAALNAYEIINESRRVSFRHNPYATKVLSTRDREYPTPKMAMTPPCAALAARVGGTAAPIKKPQPFQQVVVPPKTQEVAAPAPAPAAAPEAAAPSSDESQEILCRLLIRFKRTEEIYASCFPATIGELVSVEGDRGHDVGKVVGVLDKDGQYVAYARAKASPSERKALEAVRAEEDSAIKLCQQRVKECGLRMKIEDVEFQLDGGKLTIFFSSPAPVDFRQLQRVLFRDFRCRVWLRTVQAH